MSTASSPNGDGATNGAGRRLDRRTFLRSAIAGGAAVTAGSLLDASATGAAGGGSVVVWSSAQTDFFGTADALDVGVAVPLGVAGHWLPSSAARSFR